MQERLVVIGNGMAGIRVVEEILKAAPNRYRISIFGDERAPAYDRIKLSSLLGGEISHEDVIIHDHQWYQTNGIELISGREVVEIDRAVKCVITADAAPIGYDKLILATGSHPVLLDLPGKNLEGVVAFRTLEDVDKMLQSARQKKKAVVIGGGLLGLEAAYGLQKQGMEVAVVHIVETLMDRQLDSASGRMLGSSLVQRGLRFLMPKATQELLGDAQGRVRAVRFADGEEIEADLVVMAVGIRPRIELAKKAGLRCGRGIIVDDHMVTSDPSIFAVGECVEHRQATYGLVAPLYEMAKTLARRLAAPKTSIHAVAPYVGSITSAKLKVTGIEMFSAGNNFGSPDSEDVVMQDPFLGIYKKLVIQKNKISGIILYGDTADSAWYFQMMKEGTDISEIREGLIFGRSMIKSRPGESDSLVAQMTDEMEICGCNGVCKGTIIQAIQNQKLTSLEEVRAHTKASASCGSCTGLVKEVLAMALGPDVAVSASPQGMCPCTEQSADQVRKAIRERRLLSIEAVMNSLAWKNPEGCQKCRPALNYYLLSEFPGVYQDHSRSRFVNERMHANIQRDGTYSVVPRMWGGVTTPGELRAIAEVAEKYRIPTVKVTGGQRIDLLGVPKEDLPGVWRDLNAAGMVSGHAYGKALRTVKTCVGSEWCRFGVQDSTTMGILLEKMSWGSWTPHKVKMGVSGCPRNCAEATIKDFGVVAVESGWEIHVGGNGGMKVRVADRLCKVETQEDVLEYAGAFLQLYRKEARYLERTAHWIERVGLDEVRARIHLDAANRKRLYQEFLEAQQHFQTDPWEQLATVDSESPLNVHRLRVPHALTEGESR